MEVITMTSDELKRMLTQGERVDVEYKKAERSVPKSVYETYSAFANTEGVTSYLVYKRISRQRCLMKDFKYKE